ncbi:CoA transferase [Actinomadura sp. WMMB 499]|uniref:CoA transferase n=1 Tax=Actinomadura sp. WMMB 499 TaxID=1219491 RepID=UPI00124739E6|nr:CoA transferase [Actinomadura sp. WMMB 499]QFG26130.1 CoA transferase [Actinomadura sp. WMMB 499]
MSGQVEWAASGVAALTGRPDGPPLIPPGRGALAARELAERLPVPVDGPRVLAERAAFTGHRRGGTVSAGGSCRLLRTADGWAAVSCARPDDPALLGAMIGADTGSDPWPGVAAWLRAHSGDELAERAELLGIAAGPVGRTRRRAHVPAPLPPRPVEGLLVADFSALWAGPLCAHLLGLAGARVVKVETPSRPDGARRGNPDFYRLLHAGHRSVVLDPGTAAGRDAMAALVDAADIVVEASRPRALARFGLDADAAVAAGTTWVSITAYGRDADRVGFGDDVAAACGLVRREPDGTPLFCGDAIADPLTGLTAAALAATAPPGGGGVLWDVAMSDVVAGTLAGADAGPPPAAVRHGGGWALDTGAGGLVPVAEPVRREVPGTAPESGRDTAEVLRELGLAR